MLRTQLRITNKDTGESWDQDFVEDRPKQPPKDKDWTMSSQCELTELGTCRLPGQDVRVMLVLMGICQWASQVHITRTALASMLGITTQNLRKSLRRLQQEQFIWCDPDDRASFIIDPKLCWKGKTTGRNAARIAFNGLFATGKGD